MMCICGLPCHETPSGDQWKVQVNGMRDAVLLQIQDREGEQVRIPLSQDGAASLVMDIERAITAISRGREKRAGESPKREEPESNALMSMLESSQRIRTLEEDFSNHLAAHSVEDRERRRDDLLSPRERCRKHGVQACYCCERLACVYNVSPGAELFRAAKKYLQTYKGVANTGIAEVFEAVKKLEEMG